MPAGLSSDFRSNNHCDVFERLTAVILVTLERLEAASTPEYFLLRFFFCLTIYFYYTTKTLPAKQGVYYLKLNASEKDFGAVSLYIRRRLMA